MERTPTSSAFGPITSFRVLNREVELGSSRVSSCVRKFSRGFAGTPKRRAVSSSGEWLRLYLNPEDASTQWCSLSNQIVDSFIVSAVNVLKGFDQSLFFHPTKQMSENLVSKFDFT